MKGGMTDVRFCGTAFCIVDLMGDIEAPDRETERRAQEKQKEITFQNGVDILMRARLKSPLSLSTTRMLVAKQILAMSAMRLASALRLLNACLVQTSMVTPLWLFP